MNINIFGICVTVVVSIVALALAIYLGLRSFTKEVSEKVETVKKEVVGNYLVSKKI